MRTPEVDLLLARARSWLPEDPDTETRAELEQLIVDVEAGGNPAELADRFDHRLTFGTAGLRGALGAGPNRMNRMVVTRAAAGLAAYLLDRGADRGSPVVVGYDARRNSEIFATDTAEVLTGAGLEALLLPRPLPTPILAYAIRELGCVAGVMVTASHNPPQDNGYKVFLGDGSQIVAPTDTDIAERIEQVAHVDRVPRGRPGRVLGEEIINSYTDTVADLVEDGPRDLDLVYTPLHGVGADPVLRVLETAGFPTPRVVVSQEEPDAAFPTVAFPNPEEPGAMDAALALAGEHGADLVLANDPDADRCAVAVPTVDGPGWRMLHGDEVGALLAHHLLTSGRRGTYAATIVSSSLLGRMATAHGQPYAETLTGFKWISRVPGLVYGYEEALGYCVDPEHVADKDGISALLLVAELAAALKAEGRTLNDLLDDLATAYGVHATDQISVRVEDQAAIPATMTRLRSTPPTELGGLAVDRVDDLAAGSDGLPPAEGLRFRLAEATRVVVRPSGTEPKLKCYLEAVVPVAGTTAEALADARGVAAGRLEALRRDVSARVSTPG